MTGITELHFISLGVPSVKRLDAQVNDGWGDGTFTSPFENMSALTAIYVPARYYDPYLAALHSYLPDGVELLAKWELNSGSGTADGIPEGTSAQELTEYFGADGEEVKLLDANGQETDTATTGCTLQVGDETYEVVVRGDVDGNGEIDMDDMFSIIDHMNGENDLDGAYKKAGCVVQSEYDEEAGSDADADRDIDLDDLFAEADYINTGSFVNKED